MKRALGVLALLVTFAIWRPAFPAPAQPRFAIFFLAVGNTDYVAPTSPDLRGFGRLEGANDSARAVSDIFARNGAVAGITLTSAEGRYVGKTDVDQALSDIFKRMKASRAANPFLVFYFAGHGISEGVAWNHFSVPGNFAYAHPLDRLDVEAMARHAINAALLADTLRKSGVPYLMLLDNCYDGRAALFESPVLTPTAIDNLRQIAGVLRFINEFHGPNPVIFSAEPGREVPLAPDPRHPKQASLGPLGRRLVLLSSRLGAATGLKLSELVALLTSAQLDDATSPPVTHATAPGVDGVLLSSSPQLASVETRSGTATSPDPCCDGDARTLNGGRANGARQLRGGLWLRGPTGEPITNGRGIALPKHSVVTVSEPDASSVELGFAVDDDWELDLAAPEGRALVAGTYRGATRYGFQRPGEPGLALTGAGGACNEVIGEFTVTRLLRDGDGRIRELAATFTQSCDGRPAKLSGSVTIGGT